MARAYRWRLRKLRDARAGRKASRLTLEKPKWVVSSRRPQSMRRATLWLTKPPQLTWAASKHRASLAALSTRKPVGEAGAARIDRRGSVVFVSVMKFFTALHR